MAAALVAAACLAAGRAEASWFQLPAPLAQLASPDPASPDMECRRAIKHEEAASGIPPSLMTAVALVESGRRMTNGKLGPWPWSINERGVDHIFQSKAEVIAAVRELQAEGVQSIDVGCMQVNLMYHAGAFASLEDAFDPVQNAKYAAGFLTRLRAQTGSWEQATADYHSATPELGAPYAQKVLAMMSTEAVHDPQQTGGLQQSAELQQPADLRKSADPQQLPEMPAHPIPAAMMFSGIHQAPTFFSAAPAQMIRSLTGSPGRSLDAYRINPVMLNYRVQPLRAVWR